MRRVTRNLLVGIAVVVALLLALGALPGLLKTGDPYYVTAAEAEGNHTAVNLSKLNPDHFPYATAAIAEGRSDPYWKGPFGLKESFSHSPFDEFGAFAQYEYEAREGDTVWVTKNGTLYRLSITQEP